MFFSIALILFLLLIFRIKGSSSIDQISKRILLIYVIVWGLTICCSSLDVFDLHTPSLKLRCFLVGHVIAFVLGYKLVKINQQAINKFSFETLNHKLDKLTDSLLFRVISAVLAAYILSLVVVFFRTLALLSLSEMRNDFYEEGLYGNLFSMINGPILSVFNCIALPVFAWMLLYKRNIFTIVLGTYLVGYASLGGGRFGYLIIIIETIFVALCVFLTNENRAQRLKQVAIVGGIMLALITSVTALRYGLSTNSKDTAHDAIEETAKSLYYYSVGPLSALDYAIENHYESRINGYQYGGLTLCSVQAFLYTFLNKVGIRYDKSDLDKMVRIKQDEYILIGTDSRWNALYSTNLYYYLDFGYFGIIIIPFFLGMLVRYTIKLMYRYNNVPFFILTAYVFNIMVLSFTIFRFTGLFDLLFVVGLYICGKHRISLDSNL